MRFSPRQFAVDLYGDGFKAISIIAPLISIGASAVKASGIGLQGVSYAWAFAPLLVWALVAYFRRHAYSKRLEGQIGDARLVLAKLRTRGVELRNQAQYGFLADSEFRAWELEAVAWNAEVIDAIKKFNEADAEWFSILDVFPPPRIEMGLFHDDVEQKKLFAMHDFRLLRLGELILRLGAPA